MALSIEQIRRAADRVAASQRLDIIGIDFLGNSKQRTLRIFIEKNQEERSRLAEGAKSGAGAGEQTGDPGIALDQLAWVTHEDCERFSRDFGPLLDVEDLVPGNEYTLEVSSPGLDRKLTTPADFTRFRGGLVSIRTNSPVAGNRNWQGRLTEVKAENVVLDPAALRQRGKKHTGGTSQSIEIAFANIEKANLLPWI